MTEHRDSSEHPTVAVSDTRSERSFGEMDIPTLSRHVSATPNTALSLMTPAGRTIELDLRAGRWRSNRRKLPRTSLPSGHAFFFVQSDFLIRFTRTCLAAPFISDTTSPLFRWLPFSLAKVAVKIGKLSE